MIINPKAAFVCIGNEILSGKTRDSNLQVLAKWLVAKGVQLAEVRIIGDYEQTIISTVNALRVQYDYVFTSGGIGPTHDDITSEAIARAFGVELECNVQALDTLVNHYKDKTAISESRKKMAYVPIGAELIHNSHSGAVGFQMDNVFVLAGVPVVFQVMLNDLDTRVSGGAVLYSKSIEVYCGESHIASELGKIQRRHTNVEIGSYPKFDEQHKYFTELVFRSHSKEDNRSAIAEITEWLMVNTIEFHKIT